MTFSSATDIPPAAPALLAVALVAGWAFFRTYQPPPVNLAAHPSFNAAIYAVNQMWADETSR
jgi:hypothetical protein